MLASAIPERTPVRASMRPSGSTTFAWPGKRSRPKLPHWFADAHTTWFSNARVWSSRLKWRTCRSRLIREAGSTRLTGQAASDATITAPSSESSRADSGKTLS